MNLEVRLCRRCWCRDGLFHHRVYICLTLESPSNFLFYFQNGAFQMCMEEDDKEAAIQQRQELCGNSTKELKECRKRRKDLAAEKPMRSRQPFVN
jgi:hypothetical protein